MPSNSANERSTQPLRGLKQSNGGSESMCLVPARVRHASGQESQGGMGRYVYMRQQHMLGREGRKATQYAWPPRQHWHNRELYSGQSVWRSHRKQKKTLK